MVGITFEDQTPNIRCPRCKHEFYSAAADQPGIFSTTCPGCGQHFDESCVECWAQTIWPYTLAECSKMGISDPYEDCPRVRPRG